MLGVKTVNLKGWVVRFSCLVLVLSRLIWVGTGFADMPNPGPQKHNVEIEGAKIISEGGYLWFHVVNHDYRGLCVVVHPPSDVIVIGNASTVAYLHTNESVDFYFQVLYYWNGSQISVQSPTKELRFVFEIYTQYRTSKMTDENVEFDVSAVPLNHRVDDWNLFYFAVFTVAAVVATVILIRARLGRQDKRKSNLEQAREL
jgi:hypothetical protein